jgi:hypothetical protein
LKLNTLQKWNIANRLASKFNYRNILFELKSKLSGLKIEINERIIDKLGCNNPSFSLGMTRIAFIDFEGNPVFLCGILMYDTILTFYIKEKHRQNDFFLAILKVLVKTKDMAFFCFSEYERVVISNIFRTLQANGYNLSSYNCIESIPLINLQIYKFESLTEAIYSINFDSSVFTGDSLFRDKKIIDKLLLTRKFKDIVVHNQNCLQNACTIFLKRWLRDFTLSGEC